MQPSLFREFAPTQKAKWLEEISRDLKGKSFEETLIWNTIEGFPVQPFYTQQDSKPVLVESMRKGDWFIREIIEAIDLSKANELALHALNRGATAIVFCAEPKTRSELQTLLNGIWIEASPIHFYTLKQPENTLALYLREALERKIDPGTIRGSLNFDFISDIVTTGDDDKDGFNKASELLRMVKNYPEFKVITIRAEVYQNAGGSLVQELGYALATANEYLVWHTEQGFSAEELLGHLELSFAVGTNYFMEIAKFRAARLLFQHLASVYNTSKIPTIHATSATWNKSIYDAHNNLIRSTIEAMAAANGGADSLCISNFDALFAHPNEFSLHLARNTSLILKDESHLNKVTDVAEGSYFIESLTESIAKAAWSLFQEIDSNGGMIQSLKSGIVQKEIIRVRDLRVKLLSENKEHLIGVTKSVNHEEKAKSKLVHKPSASLPNSTSTKILHPFRAAQHFEELRLSQEK